MKRFLIVFIFVLSSVAFISGSLFPEPEKKRIECLLELVEQAWEKRDGGAVSIVNTAIVELMVLAPRETIEWMSSKVEIEKELISEWQYLVFTDHTGEKHEELSEMKVALLESLNGVNFKKEEMNLLKKRLVESLIRIQIRAID